MGIINLDGSHFVDQEIEGGREPPPSLTGEPTAMHEVNPLQCNNSYSGDCGRAGRTGGLTPIPRPGSEAGRGTEGSVSARALGDAQRRELGHPFPFPLPGEGELPQVPQSPASPPPPNPHPRPSLARPSLGGHVSPSGSEVRASCGRASPWEGCAGGGHGSGPQPCRAPVARGEVPARQATPQPGAPGAGGRGGAGPGKPPGRAPERASAARAPVAGEKSAPGPAPSPRAQRPLLVRPRSYAETPPGPRQRAAAEGR